jgi:hypothetical protein
MTGNLLHAQQHAESLPALAWEARYVEWKLSSVAAQLPAVSVFPDEPGRGFAPERDVAADQP